MRVLLHTHVMKAKKTSLNYFGEAGVAGGACGLTPAFLEDFAAGCAAGASVEVAAAFAAGAALDLLETGNGY